MDVNNELVPKTKEAYIIGNGPSRLEVDLSELKRKTSNGG